MGTTATALVLRPDGAWVSHVGDSRAYRVRDGVIEQLSFDHSMVWEYARRQKIDPDDVQGIPSNVIFRSLGPEPLVPVDIEGIHPIRSGDVYVLCSDGLSGQVGDAEIGAVASTLPPAEACRFLIDLANLRGGPDNITVIVVRVGGELATAPPPRQPWHERIPWPLPTLFLGALLTGGAIALALNQMTGVAAVVFLMAAVTIGGGLAGLFVQHAREKRRQVEEADRPRPKIHRSQLCALDAAVLEKFARTAQALKALAREKSWQADFDTFDALFDAAETHMTRRDYKPAFRDLCRAMQALLRAMGGPAGKAEVFSPRWDSEAVKHSPVNRGGNGHEPPAFRCDSCGKVSPQPPGKVTPMCCERPMKKM
jgi:protein phosphatase